MLACDQTANALLSHLPTTIKARSEELCARLPDDCRESIERMFWHRLNDGKQDHGWVEDWMVTVCSRDGPLGRDPGKPQNPKP
jgi:hypothetical protein